MAGSRTLKLSILADVDNLKKNLDVGSKEVEGFSGKLEKFGKMAAAAFAAAAAAAAAYAVKLAVDGVKAAIEDEAAQNRLANALRNVTNATESQIASVEDQITKMSLAFGVADDQLRPAYQRLAVATGDLEESEKGLQLALDISAATGKSVEAVANALGKAYEGNTAALGRLGVGLSAAEIKTLGLDGTMAQLAETFGGAATVQANTLEGQIARLRVGFDEAKEAVGAGLLPIIQNLMNYFVNVLIPKFIEAKDKAIAPIKKAFEDNREAMMDLWDFTKKYLIPLFENTLIKAIEGVGKAIGGIINIVGSVVTAIQGLVSNAIRLINNVIEAYNRIPLLPNVPTIPQPGGGGAASGGQRIELPGGAGTITVPSGTTSGGTSRTGGETVIVPAAPKSATKITDETGLTDRAASAVNKASDAADKAAETAKKAAEAAAKAIEKAADPSTWMPDRTASVADWRARESGDVITLPPTITAGSTFDPARFRMAEEGNITIVVQAPSVIDQNGFADAVTDALNQTQRRRGGGLGVLID